MVEPFSLGAFFFLLCFYFVLFLASVFYFYSFERVTAVHWITREKKTKKVK